MKGKFIKELKECLSNFELKKALELSDRIHEAEGNGYSCHSIEDTLWYQLTIRIEQTREIMKRRSK